MYEYGYDGHSYRALAYFPEKLPQVKQEINKVESTEAKVQVYKVEVNGVIYCGKAGDLLIDSTGNKKPIEDFVHG